MVRFRVENNFITFSKFDAVAKPVQLAIIFFIISASIGLKFVHLGADSPAWFIPNDDGYHIDEGYKTFASKNLVVFDSTRWHPRDKYGGWMNGSPFTQWSFYAAFENLGLDLKNARAVNVIYFGILLIITAFFVTSRLGAGLALLAVSLFVVDPGLFQFSRRALFEIPICLLMYCGIYLIPRLHSIQPKLVILFLGVAALVIAKMVKMSAILYMAPAIVIVAIAQLEWGKITKQQLLKIGIPTGLILVSLTSYFLFKVSVRELDILGTLTNPIKLFYNPTYALSPLILLIAYLGLMEIILKNPRAIFDDPYRVCIVSVFVISPLILSFFTINPPRYYVPIIPAAILFIAEWTHLRGIAVKEMEPPNLLCRMFAIYLFCSSVMMVVLFGNEYVLKLLPLDIGDDPGLSDVMILKLYPVFLLMAAVTIWIILRNRKNTAQIYSLLGKATVVFLMVHIIVSIGIQSATLLKPSYDSKLIAAKIIESAGPGESVAGDWAPFFTAESEVPSLYLHHRFHNLPDDARALGIDYFIYSDTYSDKRTLASLRENPGVNLSQPGYLGNYLGREISIYRMSYQ